eukprot:TRINITY_DN2417_c0_g1_i7.p6 TRINITY_DN2417_c0_g1~~TRINITY_DN2417_c0_g1_i7.p6  ORF type:complete len:121 (-),score=46.96 TRINITY_DN2417_c0_g1_i7:794-1156(-)
MGTEICAGCEGAEKEHEITIDHEEKPIELAQPLTVIADYSTNKAPDPESNRSTADIETEMSQKFWNIVKNQVEYGDNPRVREVEMEYGPFQFDQSLLDDTTKIVVGPLLLDNGAAYYGHW